MNSVALLMRKEFMYLFKNLKYNWVLSLICVTIFCILVPSLSFVTVIITPYFLVYGIMAHEEQNHSDALNYTLPVSRKDICISRYLSGLVYAIVTALGVSITLSTGLVVKSGYNVMFKQMEGINIFSILVGIALIYTAIIIPIIYKFGCIKMRIAMLVIYILCFACSEIFMSILQEMTGGMSIEQVDLNTQVVIEGAGGGWILLIGGIIYIVSYVISVGILNKKEV